MPRKTITGQLMPEPFEVDRPVGVPDCKVESERPAIGEPGDQGAEDSHHPQCDDEGLDPARRYRCAVQNPG